MDPAVHTVLRLAIGLLLANAAWHKGRETLAFRASLAAYQIVPASMLGAAAAVVLFAEGLLAALLLAGFAAPAAPLGAALLLMAYAGAMAWNLLRGRTDLDCGCMGPASRVPVAWPLVLRNLVFVLAALLAAVPVAGRPLGLLDLFAMAAALGGLALLHGASERVLALAPRAAELSRRSRRAGARIR